MSATAFNRSRRQAEALQDAKARDDEAQNKPLNTRMDARQLAEFSRNAAEELPKMASPPYPDMKKLINIPADANLDREVEAYKQSMMNRTRVLTDEAREELSNSHLRDDKVKAIPDHDEAGQDRSQFGMASLQEQAYADYQDPRSPTFDGRIRATEEYAKRPDVDTTESKASRQKATPLVEDDDPKTVGAIIERGMAAAQKRIEADAAVALAPTSDDPAEMKEKGASKFVPAPPKTELAEEPPAPAHSSQPDMQANATEVAPQAPSEPPPEASPEEDKAEDKPARSRPRKSKED
jgi:hypothetical protein